MRHIWRFSLPSFRQFAQKQHTQVSVDKASRLDHQQRCYALSPSFRRQILEWLSANAFQQGRLPVIFERFHSTCGDFTLDLMLESNITHHSLTDNLTMLVQEKASGNLFLGLLSPMFSTGVSCFIPFLVSYLVLKRQNTCYIDVDVLGTVSMCCVTYQKCCSRFHPQITVPFQIAFSIAPEAHDNIHIQELWSAVPSEGPHLTMYFHASSPDISIELSGLQSVLFCSSPNASEAWVDYISSSVGHRIDFLHCRIFQRLDDMHCDSLVPRLCKKFQIALLEAEIM